MDIPFLLPGKIVSLPGRGEMVVRHHQHPDASAPTILLLHGWTASSDTNFLRPMKSLLRSTQSSGSTIAGMVAVCDPMNGFLLKHVPMMRPMSCVHLV